MPSYQGSNDSSTLKGLHKETYAGSKFKRTLKKLVPKK